jgi:phospholipid/cholesterol/gamma-HCH transport system substrate-binding protein
MNRPLRLGIFIAFTLAAASAAIFLIGSKSFLFTRTYRLYANFSDVAGLQGGAPVHVAGIQEGTVRHIFLPSSPGAPVRVEMNLKDSTQHVIKQDSRASIQAQGLIGDQFITISVGSPNSPPVRSGDTIQGQTPLQMSDLVSKANTLLDTANHTLGSMDGAMGYISKAAGNLDSITGKIDNGQGSLGALVNNPALFNHFDQAAGNLAAVTGKLNSSQGSLGAFINNPSVYQHFDQAAGNLAAITGKLNSGQGSLGALLSDPTAYQNFSAAAGNLAAITGKLNSGQGSLGALLNDPSAYQNFNAAAANLNAITGKINSGQGSIGQMINDPSAYENLNRTAQNFQDDSEALKHSFFLRSFFKKRGYENDWDLDKDAIPGIPPGPPARRFNIPASRLFKGNNDAQVKNGKALDEAGAYLKSHPFSLAVVSAETGMQGDTDTQRKLTEARAYAARQWLVNHFPLDDTRIKMIGLGKRPDVPPTGEVSILIYTNTAAPAKAATGVADRSAKNPAAPAPSASDPHKH